MRLESPFPATFPEKLLETHTAVSLPLVEMETGNKIGFWQILLSHVFQLIRTISYEEEHEVFIPGILYSVVIIIIIIIMMMMKQYIVM